MTGLSWLQGRAFASAHFNCDALQRQHCWSRSQPTHRLGRLRLSLDNTRAALPQHVRRPVTCISVATVGEVNTAESLPRLVDLDGQYESKHAFAHFANWLIPGRVLLSRYPYVEPSMCRTRSQGETHLQAVLEAGVTVFVCLQAELPPQEEMKVGGVDGFLPYRPTATLIASALSGPTPAAETTGLRNQYLDKFLPPRRKQVTPVEGRIRLEFLHRPITDLDIPSAEMLSELLDDLERRVHDGQKLVIHCWGGRGRAGTVGACLLVRLYGISADEALQRVQRAFDTRRDGGRRSPETPEQLAFVRSFCEQQL